MYKHLSKIKTQTRMHSSRMRTGRSLTVCCSLLPGGGGLPIPGGGFSLLGGGLPVLGGVCLFWGEGGGSAWSGGGAACSGGGSPCRGGVCLVRGRGVCLVPGGGPARRTPPMDRITDTCKNITLATTSLRPVKIYCLHV